VARENRRLAAIVAVDVVGYSRLMGADEEGTLQALRAHRSELIDRLLREHGGRIANTAGDSLLIEFASAVDAVRCSMAVQEAMVQRNADTPPEKRLNFRIGINVGDVIAEGEDLLGDGVNIAARLEGICPSGGVMLSDDAHRQIRNRLDTPFVMDGVKGLKNIVEPITVWRWAPSGIGSPDNTAPAHATTTMPPVKPSIAILPFNDLSRDPEIEAFADGLTEDIINGLSRSSVIDVAARNSSFAYKGQAPDTRDVAETLGVRYVLDGSVRRVGTKMRITVQLVDAATGNHVWADRFDRAAEDLFDMLDEIANRIASLLSELIWQDIAKKAAELPPEEYGPYDHFLAGTAALHLFTPAGVKTSQEHYIASIELNPDLTYVHSALGLAYSIEWLLWGNPAVNLVESIRHHAVRARELAPNDALAYRLNCRSAMINGAFEESKRHAERALKLEPANGDLILLMACYEMHAGDLDIAHKMFEEVLQIHSETPHSAEIVRLWTSFAHFISGDPSTAKATANEISGVDYARNLILSACHAALGEMAEARARTDALLKEVPGMTVCRLGLLKCFRDPERVRGLREALLAAGLPE
jgi:TolB-like protein/class 3 adenylate cyclase